VQEVLVEIMQDLALNIVNGGVHVRLFKGGIIIDHDIGG